jgi:hypothetical protein
MSVIESDGRLSARHSHFVFFRYFSNPSPARYVARSSMKSVQLLISSRILSGFAPPAAVSAGHAHTGNASSLRAMVLMNLARPTAPALCIYICALHALLLCLHVAPRVSAAPDSELCAPRNLYIYISVISPFLALAAHLPPFHYPCPCNLPCMINPARMRCEFRDRVTSQHRACTSYRCTESMSAHRVLNPPCIGRARRLHSYPVQDCLSSAAGTESTC